MGKALRMLCMAWEGLHPGWISTKAVVTTFVVRQSISVCSYCNTYEYSLGETLLEQKSLQGYARYITSKIIRGVMTCDLKQKITRHVATLSSSNWLSLT